MTTAPGSDDPKPLLSQVDHRLYPLPKGPWATSLFWNDMLFMDLPVPIEVLHPLVPPQLELDTFEGTAWLGWVPFRLSEFRGHYLPGVPGLREALQRNLRTYVSLDGKPGVWFFSADCANPTMASLARAVGLPYLDAGIWHSSGEEVGFESLRTHRGADNARFAARYRPVGRATNPAAGTLKRFLTGRHCYYHVNSRGSVWRADLHFAPLPLQPAEMDVEANTVAEVAGINTPQADYVLGFVRRQWVLVWPPRRVR